MVTWLNRLLGRTDGGAAVRERLLALEREVQQLRLERDQQARQLDALRDECGRLRAGQGDRTAEAVRDRMERLLTDAAGPVAQLMTQAHLLEEGKPVQARDVLAVARRLVRVLQDEGLTLEGSVGERVVFDPGRHAPLGGDVPAAGDVVVVRFAGVACRGRLLRKAGVEREQG